jgi:hypothetical protein
MVEVNLSNNCRICFKAVNINDYPSVMRVCKCSEYVHIMCFREKLDVDNPNCPVCMQLYIWNISHDPVPIVERTFQMSRWMRCKILSTVLLVVMFMPFLAVFMFLLIKYT